jgi:hypothetical protein
VLHRARKPEHERHWRQGHGRADEQEADKWSEDPQQSERRQPDELPQALEKSVQHLPRKRGLLDCGFGRSGDSRSHHPRHL